MEANAGAGRRLEEDQAQDTARKVPSSRWLEAQFFGPVKNGQNAGPV
jgi:hypothetical protein